MTEITFDKFDKFKRKIFADRLKHAITTFYTFVEGAYVLSLNAKFGSGKSTFLKMWTQDLQADGYKVININAWETDFDEDPIIPITAAFLDQIPKGNKVKNVKVALRGLLGASALVGNKFLEQTTGLNVFEIGKEIELDLKQDTLPKLGEEIHRSYNFKINAYKKLKQALLEYTNNLDKKPLIILIDELDRVRPDYSIKFLEAIKHIFSVHGVCFVLAIDKEQLKSSTKQLYGEIDFNSYYLRFITREVQLPTNEKIDSKVFIDHLSGQFFNEQNPLGLNFCFDPNTKKKLLISIQTICKIFLFSLREIEHFFRIITHFFAIEKENVNAKESWLDASIFLIAVSLKKEDIYHKIGKGEINGEELNNYIELLSFSKKTDDKRYIILNALAFNLRANDETNDRLTHQIVSNNGYINIAGRTNSVETTKEVLSRLISDFGDIYYDSTFQQIYDRLENWKNFIE